MRYKIAPSILSADFAQLKKEIEAVKQAGADLIHIDVMDGHFVPNLTIGPPVVASIRKITDLPLDVHLMIEAPDRLLEAFANAGADILTVHVEACPHLHRTIETIKSLGKNAGVALNPATPLHFLEPILAEVNLVLIMSVNPGFSGQSFIPSTLKRIEAVKDMLNNAKKEIDLEVDGGISEKNIKSVASKGANIFVAGSAIFDQSDYKDIIKRFRAALDEH
ncbi:MAG: ribulose phosphate epimerase [Syntrophobacter sp. DG_60]|nr:MAG: ribulose phosphate epimerase [Syntrophobacter sp. DG_60]